MQLRIRADDGDQVVVRLDQLAIEQAVVKIVLEGGAYPASMDFENISLTPARARDLGRALVLAANVLEDAARLQLVADDSLNAQDEPRWQGLGTAR